VGPAMPQLSALVIIVPCFLVIGPPAILIHALIRNLWIACVTTSLLAFCVGYVVAEYFGLPDSHVKIASVAALLGAITSVLLAVPFVLYRTGMWRRAWSRVRAGRS